MKEQLPKHFFPLGNWTTFKVFTPARGFGDGAWLYEGITWGKPGEERTDVLKRAGQDKQKNVVLEYIDR